MYVDYVSFFVFKVNKESNLSVQKSSTRIICDLIVYNSKCYRILQNLITTMFLELKCMYTFNNKKTYNYKLPINTVFLGLPQKGPWR